MLFGVAKAYYEVLKQQKIVAGDKNTLDLAEKQLQLAQNQYDAGAVSRVDVLRGQSTLETARQSLIGDQNTLALERNTLANMLNFRGPARDFDVVQPEDATEDKETFEGDLAQAYRDREDYKKSAIGIDQSIEQKNEVVGEYAPTLAAALDQNWAEPARQAHYSGWGAALTVNVPIFTGGQREIDLRTARHNIEEAKIALETSAKDVENDVKTTWLRVETLRETIQSLKAQVAADEQNYKDLLNQYLAGAATSLDTQTALTQLVTANTSLISEIYDYQVALRDLQRSVAAFQDKRIKALRTPSFP